MNKIQRNRLRKLINFMKTEVKKEWFDFGVWADHGFEEQKCGTQACALGWATQLFPRHMELYISDNNRSTLIRSLDKKCFGIEVAMNFFGLHQVDADYLFLNAFDDDTRAMTPKEWSKIANKFLKHKEKEAANA